MDEWSFTSFWSSSLNCVFCLNAVTVSGTEDRLGSFAVFRTEIAGFYRGVSSHCREFVCDEMDQITGSCTRLFLSAAMASVGLPLYLRWLGDELALRPTPPPPI